MGPTNKDFKSQNITFDEFPTPETLSCWKIRFKTEECSCSHCLTEAVLWIKEVEMVNSVEDRKSSCSIQGLTPFPDFELLDARIASVSNKIIQNSYFKKKVSLETKKLKEQTNFFAEDRSLT